MDTLAHWLKTLTGMPAVALSPKAGAHGELCGLMAIRAAHEAKGEHEQRRKVLVPTSAHGTNPATAAFVGYSVVEVAQTEDGRVDVADLASKLGPDVAAIMVTNPNTCGLFERDIIEIARLTHEAGAISLRRRKLQRHRRPGPPRRPGRRRHAHQPAQDLLDAARRRRSRRGSGGAVRSPGRLRPCPWVVHDDNGYRLIEREEDEAEQAFGRLCAFQGQMGMYVRALSYMMSHGSDGLRQVAEDAVLNANYIKARLQDLMSPAFPDGPCMHEALFDDEWLKGTDITTLDFAKAMIDEGFHPMTMYFPLVVHGAMLIEPTETESKAELDRFIHAMRLLAEAAKAGDVDRFKGAPFHAPLKRLDETRAARSPVLRWSAPEGSNQAA